MAYVMLALLILLIAGAVWWAVLGMRRRSGDLGSQPDGTDVTDRSMRPAPPSGRALGGHH